MMLPLVLLGTLGVGLWFFMQTKTPKSDAEQVSRAAHSREKENLIDLYPLASDIINQWDWTEDWRLESTDMRNDARELHNQRARL